jgi:putative DNA-invertase from lambdoid prophage Rac
MKLVERLERAEVLIVTKLDSLGRNAMDLTVTVTVAKLAELGVRVHCLALRGADLTSAAGRMTSTRSHSSSVTCLIERTQSGLERARAAGTPLGRPRVLNEDQQAAVRAQPFRPASTRQTTLRQSPAKVSISNNTSAQLFMSANAARYG